MDQFHKISSSYTSFVEGDPFRNYLHYPAVLNELGDLSGELILDVGCGDGRLPRLLAVHGAVVCGYDSAEGQIEVAKSHQEHYPDKIRYVVATPQTFISDENADHAVSVLVLPYAEYLSGLQAFFQNTFKNIKGKGKFISVVFNPDFVSFDQKLGCRRFLKINDQTVEVQFIDTQSREVSFRSHLSQFSKEEYENTAQSGGFNRFTWQSLHPTDEGLNTLGKSFWDDYERDHPYTLFIAQKD